MSHKRGMRRSLGGGRGEEEEKENQGGEQAGIRLGRSCALADPKRSGAQKYAHNILQENQNLHKRDNVPEPAVAVTLFVVNLL